MLKVLFLSATPPEASRIEVEKEYKNVREVVRFSRYRDQIDLERLGEVSSDEFDNFVMEYEPTILHFSGHGSSEGVMIFQDSLEEKGRSQIGDVADLFRILSNDKFSSPDSNIRCVVLNACYSEMQAEAISKYVECVIGMSNAITDEAALAFSESFYLGIAAGKSLQTAFELGKNEVARRGIPGQDIPHLKSREGVDPSSILLVDRKEMAAVPQARRQEASREFQMLLDKFEKDEKEGSFQANRAAIWIGIVLLLRDLVDHYGDELPSDLRDELGNISQTSAAPPEQIAKEQKRLKERLEKVILFLATGAGVAAGGVAVEGAAHATIISSKLLATLIVVGVAIAGTAGMLVYATSSYITIYVDRDDCDPAVFKFPTIPVFVTPVNDGNSLQISRAVPINIEYTENNKLFLEMGMIPRAEVPYRPGTEIFLDDHLIQPGKFPLQDGQKIRFICS
ncbi:MAG TPA: hypothetical protein VLA68_01330 [Nitrososphaera sp.]|nr:hypothetical protein [Nitrososphaera sp.]